MFRSVRFVLRKDFLQKSLNQCEQLSYFHSQLVSQKLKLHPKRIEKYLLVEKNVVFLRNLSSSTILFQATEKLEEPVKNIDAQTAAPVLDSSASAATSESAAASIASAVEPSVPSDVLQEAVAAISSEPTLVELGLGANTPVGWVQHALDYFHASSGLPWWVCIILCTLTIRTCVFPLYVISQRNIARMSEFMPLSHELHQQLSLARQRGDHFEAARISQELTLFMKKNNLNPFKNMLVPMVQGPIFLSFFMALRQMANAPVESMKYEGYAWFLDLTLPDQYYLLPLITSLTLLATLELGADFGKIQAGVGPFVKYGLRAVPVIIFPFTLHFPAAILMYWTSANTISLIQVAIFKIPGVKPWLKIPEVSVNTSQLKASKGFINEVKSTWSNMKIVQELEERQRIDKLQFTRAGQNAPVKTYKYNPTQIATEIKAKSKT